mgnify:CR=1 FL=1
MFTRLKSSSSSLPAEHLLYTRVPHVAGGEGTLKGKEADIRDVHTERENRILLNTHTDNEKGNGQHHRVLSVSFFSCNRLIPAA